MNMRLLAGLLFAVSVVGFSLGASLPLVSLRLHEAGASTLEIGIISAIPAAGMMLSAFLVDACCRHLTRRTIYLLCFSLCTVSIALLESAFGSLWLRVAAPGPGAWHGDRHHPRRVVGQRTVPRT